MDLSGKFLGAMLGGAIGDAIGELAFRYPERARLVEQLELVERLRYTDGIVMTIALAETLLERNDVDPQLLGNTLRESYHEEPWRGYGEGARSIYSLVENEGIGYIDAARRLHGGEGSYGNGAAMRVTPVSLYFYNSPDLYEKVKASAEVTHAHPVGIDGAAVLARAQAVTATLNNRRPFSPEALLDDLIAFARTAEMRGKLESISRMLVQPADAQQAAETLGMSVLVHESVPFALYAFLRHPHTFIECVLFAVLNGGNRDSLGAMAGAVAGAYLGIEAIPVRWRNKLENDNRIEALARELAARA